MLVTIRHLILTYRYGGGPTIMNRPVKLVFAPGKPAVCVFESWRWTIHILNSAKPNAPWWFYTYRSTTVMELLQEAAQHWSVPLKHARLWDCQDGLRYKLLDKPNRQLMEEGINNGQTILLEVMKDGKWPSGCVWKVELRLTP